MITTLTQRSVPSCRATIRARGGTYAAIFGCALLIIGSSNFYWLKPDRSSLTSTARAFFPSNNSQVRIIDTKTSDGFAVAGFRAGQIEGELLNGQLLLQHFTFGWQVIDLSSPGFAIGHLQNHGISSNTATHLYDRAVGSEPRDSHCLDNCLADAGSQTDINAIRSLTLVSRNEAIGPVVVSSDYAMAGWWGNGGGEMLFFKTHGLWKMKIDSGGCFNFAELVKHGVPVANARILFRRFTCGPLPGATS
jgi:hypothetical protein